MMAQTMILQSAYPGSNAIMRIYGTFTSLAKVQVLLVTLALRRL